MPELPEMEIVARRLDEALPGETIESAMTPGLNALKTFDPPLHAIDGATFTGVRRRGKLLMLDVETAGGEPLTLLTHLMSAGRMQLFDKRASLRDRTARVLLRLPGDRELRVREFGTKQAAWIKLLRPDAVAADEALANLGPEAWPDVPEDLAARARRAAPAAHDAARPAGDRRRRPHVGRRDPRTPPSCRPSSAATTSPRPRSRRSARAIVGELGRVLDVYEEAVQLPLPEKFPKPTRIHAHQGEPCPRCGTELEAVFYEDYVMSYCPNCQTEGRVLKDRRLSRILK